jgi:predicted outer membrane repeat protein
MKMTIQIDNIDTRFINNTAKFSGSSLYGGSLHGCDAMFRNLGLTHMNTEMDPSTIASDPASVMPISRSLIVLTPIENTALQLFLVKNFRFTHKKLSERKAWESLSRRLTSQGRKEVERT